MNVKPGMRLQSAVCETQIVVVRAPAEDVDIRCGGQPMVIPAEANPPAGKPAAGLGEGALLGKRYTDEGLGLEVLCTKSGAGSLSLGDTPLALKDAKPLPASD